MFFPTLVKKKPEASKISCLSQSSKNLRFPVVISQSPRSWSLRFNGASADPHVSKLQNPYFEIPNHSQIPHQPPSLSSTYAIWKVAAFSFQFSGASPLFIRKRRSKIRGHSSTQAAWPTRTSQQQGNIRWHPKCRRFEIFSNIHDVVLFVYVLQYLFVLAHCSTQPTTPFCLPHPTESSSKLPFAKTQKKASLDHLIHLFGGHLLTFSSLSFRFTWESSFFEHLTCLQQGLSGCQHRRKQLTSNALLHWLNKKRWETKLFMYPKSSCLSDYLMLSDWPWPWWLVGAGKTMDDWPPF